MEVPIIAAIITASGAIMAAILGGFIARTQLFDRLFLKSDVANLTNTRWESVWEEPRPNSSITYKEVFTFTKHKRGKVYGAITMEAFPDLKWDIEGEYNDRFLKLFWKPSADAKNKFFLDTGCYFFERRGQGFFIGYSIGYDLESDGIETSKHELRLVP